MSCDIISKFLRNPTERKTSVLLFTSRKNVACITMTEETTYASIECPEVLNNERDIIEIQFQRIH